MTELNDNPSVEQRELTRISQQGTKMTRGAIIFLTVVIAFSFAASGYALFERFGQTDSRRTQQMQVNEQLRILSERDCRDQHATIELLHLFLTEGTRQFEARPVTPENAAELRKFHARVIVLLARADCQPKG